MNYITIPLENIDEYECYIERFTIGHSELIIQGHHPKFVNTFTLLFTGVKFLSAHTHWIGARFRIGSENECLKLLEEIRLNNFNEEMLKLAAQKWVLYLNEATMPPTVILALGVQIL